MRNYFTKRPSGAPLHTLSKLYDVPVGFVPPPPYFETEYCLFCGRRRVAVARYRMICLVLGDIPSVWKTGMISPIPKSSENDRRDPMSYRGLSLTYQYRAKYIQRF